MPDLDYNTIFDLSEQIKGKTIKSVGLLEGPHGEDYFVIDFTDGKSLKILCDLYELYEWELLG